MKSALEGEELRQCLLKRSVRRCARIVGSATDQGGGVVKGGLEARD